MHRTLSIKLRLIFTFIVVALVCLHLAWDYLHGGIPVHYLLQSDDMPGFSNSWGLVLIPVLTWFLLYRINKRLASGDSERTMRVVLYRFIGAFVFGVFISFFFNLDSNVTGYMMIGVMLLSFFVPLFYSEYLLGYVISMTYTFGAIIPILAGAILLLIFFIAYRLVRGAVLILISKIKSR